MLAVFNREDKLVAEAVERELPHIAEAVDAIAAALRAGGRLFFAGTTPSRPGCAGRQ